MVDVSKPHFDVFVFLGTGKMTDVSKPHFDVFVFLGTGFFSKYISITNVLQHTVFS